MGVLGDDINPTDHVLMGLSRGPSSEELPIIMQCPNGHIANKGLISTGGWTASQPIPYYVCYECTVVYRYQECKLVPGDEGTPS